MFPLNTHKQYTEDKPFQKSYVYDANNDPLTHREDSQCHSAVKVLDSRSK